jgi:Fe-S-cluster-containing dehydrogenase component
VRLDDDGEPPLDRYVYVQEQDCIGCTHWCVSQYPGGSAEFESRVRAHACWDCSDRQTHFHLRPFDTFHVSATTARATFFLEDEWGRARVSNQQGDAPDVIAEAVRFFSSIFGPLYGSERRPNQT